MTSYKLHILPLIFIFNGKKLLLLLLMVYLHIIALKMNYNMLTWKYTKIYKNTKI
jgi:hypothetical protein